MKNIIVAIDGPCCSGKSTIAENLAKDLGFRYIDTGLLYRAVTYICLNEGVNYLDVGFNDYILKMIEHIRFDGECVRYHGEEIQKTEIKSEKHAMVTAEYAQSKEIRDNLTCIIRELSRGESIVADGRDCCSNIFPFADYKYYFEISTDTRIKRWISDTSRQVEQHEIDEGIININRRDSMDKNREYCPLRIEPDMKVIFLDDLSIEETIMIIKKEILAGKGLACMKE